jgi:uncharacterized membrane-anchored protein
MFRRLAAALLAAAVLPPLHALAAEEAAKKEEGPKIQWVAGPDKVDLGDDLAEINLPDSVAFAGPADTAKLLELMGNIPQGTELGIIVPKADDQDWFIIFRFDGIGFVKDDDAGEIDADGLLKSIQEGTQAANEERKKRGIGTIDVLGWAEPPRYDPKTHNLTWAIRGRNDDGTEIVNYNVRVLGRKGVMEVKLVDDASKYAAAKPAVEGVLAAFNYKAGKTYAEWRPGDKVAEYGLTALVAAGAGAAAVKTGLLAGLFKLLAKGGKLIVLAVLGLFGAIGKLFGLKKKEEPAPAPAAQPAFERATFDRPDQPTDPIDPAGPPKE